MTSPGSALPIPRSMPLPKAPTMLSCFHDITSGNNFNPGSPSKSCRDGRLRPLLRLGDDHGFQFDPGAFGSARREFWSSLRPLGFTSSGPGGGPFSVTSQTYTLNNIGSEPLNWSLVNTSRWLTVSATAGTLNPGGASSIVTVSLNSTATNFLITALQRQCSVCRRHRRHGSEPAI